MDALNQDTFTTTATTSTSSAKSAVAQLIPSALTELLEPQRHFARLKLPEGKIFHIATLNNQIPQVMVATAAGYFYLFAVDMQRGGECTLVKQFSLTATSD